MKYPIVNNKTSKATIPRIFPPLFCLYICSGKGWDVVSMDPTLNLGRTPLIAWLEWAASLKALVPMVPALVWRTMGPPGCSLMQDVTSQTPLLMMIQQSSGWLCLQTYQYVIDFQLIELIIIGTFILTSLLYSISVNTQIPQPKHQFLPHPNSSQKIELRQTLTTQPSLKSKYISHSFKSVLVVYLSPSSSSSTHKWATSHLNNPSITCHSPITLQLALIRVQYLNVLLRVLILSQLKLRSVNIVDQVIRHPVLIYKGTSDESRLSSLAPRFPQLLRAVSGRI